MDRKTHLVIISVISSLLIGCNSVGKTRPSSVSLVSSQGQKSSISAKSDGRQCVDNFDLLKQLNMSAYSGYKAQFDSVNRQYAYYKANEELMEKDPKEVMVITLNDKLNMICDRVKSQTFVEIRNRMLQVSKI